jgi:hypothetical protein
MTTGKALAEATLREPMRAVGWRPRASGWFTEQIAAGHLGVAALGSASRYARPGTAFITWYIGIRDEAVEPLVSELCGLKDGRYRQRTAFGGIGYLLPDCRWREWEITLDNASELAQQLAELVPRYAEPYLHRLASDDAALLTAAKQSAGDDSTGTCRVAVLLAKHPGRDEALAFLRERIDRLGTRTDPAAGFERQAIVRARAWLAAS